MGYCRRGGKAVQWLCANELDGIGQLSLLLQREFSTSMAEHRPIEKYNVWHSDQLLCPLLAGCYLSDSADTMNNLALEIRDVVAPLLLLPFVAKLAIKHHQSFMIDCDGAIAITDGKHAAIDSLIPDLARVVKISAGGNISNLQEHQFRVIVEDGQLDILDRYARKTVAPDTEQSRLTGAGAGLTDND